MNVRCTRCRAVYTLEDVLYGGTDFKPLPPSIQVECGRCAYVFEAPVPGRAPRVSNPKLTPVPKGDAARSAQAASLAKALKPRRPGDPSAAELRGEQPGGRSQSKLLLAVGGIVVVALLALVVMLVKKRGGLPQEARTKVERGHTRLRKDDESSLANALKDFRDARRIAPGAAQPEADIAYASVLLSEAHREQADRIKAVLDVELARARKAEDEKSSGWEAAAQSAREKVAQLTTEREPHVTQQQKLLGDAHAAFTAASEDDPDDPAVLRAQALYLAVTDADKADKAIEAARAKAPHDGLALYPRAAAALSGPRSRDKLDRALSALAEVQQADPGFLRALYDSAAIAFERQQFGPAREQLKSLLAKNPLHERGRALFDLLPPSPGE